MLFIQFRLQCVRCIDEQSVEVLFGHTRERPWNICINAGQITSRKKCCGTLCSFCLPSLRRRYVVAREKQNVASTKAAINYLDEWRGIAYCLDTSTLPWKYVSGTTEKCTDICDKFTNLWDRKFLFFREIVFRSLLTLSTAYSKSSRSLYICFSWRLFAYSSSSFARKVWR